MKQAILAVSFGTTVAEAERSCIRPIEDALRSAFPEHSVRRAYSSAAIRSRLLLKGISVEGVEQALAHLRSEGYEKIAVVPTHVIPGDEYEKVLAAAAGLPVSKPLLWEDSDLDRMAGLLGGIAREEGCPLLAMGHGTEHAADEIYARLREWLPGNARLACLEGKFTLEELLDRPDAFPGKELVIMPLMIVAGAHARKILSGDGAWKSMLEARGFRVRIRMQGLGALEAVQAQFVEKAREIL